MKLIILSIIGISSGLLVAGAITALLTSIGIITRIIYKSHTQKYIHVYEIAIFLGVTICNLIYIYNIPIHTHVVINYFILSVAGLFMGVYVGCLAMSLAEILDVSTIFYRRIGLKRRYNAIILSLALGKFLGSLFYYI